MKKREFLTGVAGILVGASGSVFSRPRSGQQAACPKHDQEIVLTIAGEIANTNRGKIDPTNDQFMYKRGIQFQTATSFTLADLEALPIKTIKPTMEYDDKVHTLTGPRLIDVLAHVGIKKTKDVSVKMHGLDGYTPEVTYAKVQEYDFILATRLDGKLLSIGGLGPVFGIYDADRIEEFADKPINQRFLLCPWGIFCIEVVPS